MKLISSRFSLFFLTLLLCISLLPLESAFAQRGRGRGGFRGSGGGGASPRINRSTSLQNRGSFNSSGRTRQGNRDQFQQDRQANRDQFQQNRQGNQQERQGNRDQFQQNRQGNQQERQSNRQENQQNRQNTIQENQQNRQNFIDDNYNGDRWYGGGWYGRGYYAPPGWGAWTAAVGLAAGVAIGATVDSPPPYYSTVYVDNTPYIYSDGVYLQPQGNSYVVVAPPVDAVVSYLPDGCTSTQMNGTQYFDCSGIYYQMVYQNGTTVYQVVEF
ncbi:DUF6515 family protein [Crocosphaera subtropica]|nr:DUF6515 family protein [Crocosphaera subtropica]